MESSSKYYKELPCVIAKSLIAKYQKNKKCKQVSNLVLPVCGDKGKQIKLEDGVFEFPHCSRKKSCRSSGCACLSGSFVVQNSSSVAASGMPPSATTQKRKSSFL